MNARMSALLLSATLALASPLVSAADASRLGVCVDADNPPFSSEQQGGGVDVEVARALAAGLQRELTLHWVRVPERGGLGKALKQSIQAGQCEIFMGLPQEAEMARELAERKLATTQAYLTVGYVAVAPRNGGSGNKIGAVTATPADVFLHRTRSAERQPFGNNRELLEALRAGQLRNALVWSPALAEHLAMRKDDVLKLEAQQPQDASLRFGLLVAVSSKGSVADINRVLAELASSGRLGAIAAAHALPSL